ncbi:aspartic proteinase nepenthesin-2 [Cryptomeria japonica]|uniref:aspartic proteinase nepenthesin-2 n=1 Tax=Cryptomeria japonica TaxID=3369 RepID=UPI0027DAABEA|nr:aspartic proteinase nepenthesin-2 [Cryptomeria japonica]
MTEPLARSLCKLLLLFCVIDGIQCRFQIPKLSVNEIVGEKLPQQQKTLRVELVHRDSLSPNITATERLKRAIERSHERLQKFQLSHSYHDKLVDDIKDAQGRVSAGNGEFLLKVSIGSPALSYSAILDTGSDLTWTQCKPCVECYKQPTPIFDPSKSSTFSTIPCTSSLCQALPSSICSKSQCEYLYTYGDYSSTQGILSYESFTLSSEKLPHIAFGCGLDNEGSGFSQGGGLIGFGRGPLSFISQIGSSVGNKFSYCLMSINDPPSKTSPLILGTSAGLSSKSVGTTPLLQNSAQKTFYYLSLEGISIGSKLLDIPADTFSFQSDGSGGIIIDSGTTITYLEQSGYDVLKKGLQSAVKLPEADGSAIGLDLCYTSAAATAKFPSFIFHFKGADYVLPKENYLIEDTSGLVCLAMLPSSGLSIFGNVQQQNVHILYDLEKNTLSFAPTVCDSL